VRTPKYPSESSAMDSGLILLSLTLSGDDGIVVVGRSVRRQKYGE
jgi:hypothetical protein